MISFIDALVRLLTMQIITSDNGLCASCALIDVDAILSTKPKTYRGSLILQLGFNSDGRTTSSCSFCRLLTAIKPTSINNFKLDDLALYAFRLADRLWSYEDGSIVLGVLRVSDTKGKGSRDRIEESLSKTG